MNNKRHVIVVNMNKANKKFLIGSLIFAFSITALFYIATKKAPESTYQFDDLVDQKTPENILLPEKIKLYNAKTWQKDKKTEYIIVNFWATWCPPCLKEIPELNTLAKNKEAYKIDIIGVSMDQETALLEPFIQKTEFHYPTTTYKEVKNNFGLIQSIPTTMIFDKNNTLIYINIGLETSETLLKAIENHKKKFGESKL